MLPLPPHLTHVLAQTPALAEAYLVGGCVRDSLLGQPVKDFDIEVYGVTLPELEDALRPHGRVDVVGRSFGVIKFSQDGEQHDFSIPRRDSKTGPGHRGFRIELDPSIEPRDAAARRDFTVNAMMVHARSGRLLDFHGGEADLKHRVLRHTSAAFSEDPLRVLRGMQFASRFQLTPAPETVQLCQSILAGFGELAIERVREEWLKWAARSVQPSLGLRFLLETGWLAHFPELAHLVGVPQDPEWHPEGDVFVHTCHCLDALVSLPEWIEAPPATRIILTLAVLTHDFGKSTHTFQETRDGRVRITSPGHEGESVRMAGAFLTRLGVQESIIAHVLPLVGHHMAHFEEPTDRAVRRLARRLAPSTVQHLGTVMTADSMGRPPLPRRIPESVHNLLRVAERLALSDREPRPLLLGRHLLAVGMPPGPAVGQWTAAAMEAQLDGAFTTLRGAHEWLAAHDSLPSDLRGPARMAVERLGTDADESAGAAADAPTQD